MSRAPNVTAAAEAVLGRVGLLENPYFRALADGSMTIERFRATQQQFYFAVRFYPRPMAALLSRIPDPAHRLDLLRNLVEEHGDFHQDQFHQNTFGRLLESIGARSPDQVGIPICPAVHAFNNLLMGICLADELEVGLGCLGMIEYAFAPVSELIGTAVVKRGWVSLDCLAHYTLHADLDLRHAEEFFTVIERSWDDAAKRSASELGLELGAYAFDQLYRSLCQVPGNAA